MNIMQEIMKLLGVKENEEFELMQVNTGQKLDSHYAFNRYGLCRIKTDSYGGVNTATEMIGLIVKGDLEIVKLPWEPKKNEEYWYCGCYPEPRAYLATFLGREIDLLHLKTRNCFKTKEQAEENLEDYKDWLNSTPVDDWRYF